MIWCHHGNKNLGTLPLLRRRGQKKYGPQKNDYNTLTLTFSKVRLELDVNPGTVEKKSQNQEKKTGINQTKK